MLNAYNRPIENEDRIALINASYLEEGVDDAITLMHETTDFSDEEIYDEMNWFAGDEHSYEMSIVAEKLGISE